jgi:hypothetical protein
MRGAGGPDMGFDVCLPSLALRPFALKCPRQPREAGARDSGLGGSEPRAGARAREDRRFKIPKPRKSGVRVRNGRGSGPRVAHSSK